jgi:hypothetical protein
MYKKTDDINLMPFSTLVVTFPCPSLPSVAITQPTPPPRNDEDADQTQTVPAPPEQETLPDNIGSSTPNNNIIMTDEAVTITTDNFITLTPPFPSLIVGVVVPGVVAVILVAVVVVIAILLKKRHEKFTTIAVPTAANQAYGLNTHKGVEESIYTYPGPEMDVDNTIEAKQNMAYVTNTDVIIEANEAYATNIVLEGNEAYATSIITEGNQAYATGITTEKNAAYESWPVTTTETVNVYEIVD